MEIVYNNIVTGAIENHTSLLPLHHQTPLASVAAELLCAPQLEEDYFLWRKNSLS